MFSRGGRGGRAPLSRSTALQRTPTRGRDNNNNNNNDDGSSSFDDDSDSPSPLRPPPGFGRLNLGPRGGRPTGQAGAPRAPPALRGPGGPRNTGARNVVFAADDQARNRERDVWMRGLEHIRRPSSIVDVTAQAANVLQVSIDRSAAQTQQQTTTGNNNTPPPAPQNVINLTSPTDDGATAGTAQAATGAAFYGLQNLPLNEQNTLLRYQQQNINPGQLPSPAAGTRFDMALLYADCNQTAPADQAVQAAIDFARYRGGGSIPAALDDAITANWRPDAGPVPLIRGLPLAEDVVFFRAQNLRGTPSNCYWKAVAYQQYGDSRYDMRVKAEHLSHVGEVLSNPAHPRHAQYTQLNSRFWPTVVAFGAAPGASRQRTCANLWQLLNVPCIWTPMDMFDVTADLYNWYIMVYTISQAQCTEVTARGSYNARHVLMLFLGTHYQPIVPNDFYASEFQMMRPTFDNMAAYPFAAQRTRQEQSARLAVRSNGFLGGALAVERGPPAVNWPVSGQAVRSVMTGGMRQGDGGAGQTGTDDTTQMDTS